jgi:hypothetical protein
MKNVTKNLLLGLFVLTLGACGSDDNNQMPYQPYYPGAISGLACAELNHQQKLGVFFGNLGNGAKFAIDIYQSTGDQIAAVGDIYIPDMNRFWNPSMYTPVGQTQQFVSCLTSNGFNGSLYSYGTGARRDIDVVLHGQGITITLGSSIPGTMKDTQVTGNNIVGPAYIQVNGGADIFVLDP